MTMTMTREQRKADADDIARAGVEAVYAGTRSLASRERLYVVDTEFGPYRIFRDNGVWVTYMPEETGPVETAALPAVVSPLTAAVAQVARDLLARRG